MVAWVRLQINQPKGADGLPEIRKAFEFTVEKMGADIASGPLWQEYIAFLEVRLCHVPSQLSTQHTQGAVLPSTRRSITSPGYAAAA